MDRFEAKVDKSPGHGPAGTCWLWTGSKHWKGHGRYCKNGTTVPAAREAWEREYGVTFPEGKHACHRCDFPPCVNGKHIFPGTPRENTQDAIAKGRFKPVKPMKKSSHCRRGHELSGDNLGVDGSGKRRCRECRRLNQLSRTKKRTEERAKTSRIGKIERAARALIAALGEDVSPSIREHINRLNDALKR